MSPGTYKKRVLDKVSTILRRSLNFLFILYCNRSKAFARGYDPALELATRPKKYPPRQLNSSSTRKCLDGKPTTVKNQATILCSLGQRHVSLCLLTTINLHSPQGSGKGTMIFDSMSACKAEGVSMCDAHPIWRFSDFD